MSPIGDKINPESDLSPIGRQNENGRNCAHETLPQNERQARALANYPEEKQIEIWRKAVETAEGRISAAHIKKTARQIHGKIVKDKDPEDPRKNICSGRER